MMPGGLWVLDRRVLEVKISLGRHGEGKWGSTLRGSFADEFDERSALLDCLTKDFCGIHCSKKKL